MGKTHESFCRRLIASSVEKANQSEKLANEVKNKSKEVVLEGLGCCNKIEVTFELKDKVKPDFIVIGIHKKRITMMEDIGVIKKVDYSDWASPTDNVKKKQVESMC